MVNLEHLITENRNPETMDLDSITPMEIVTVMNREDERVVNAVKEVLPDVARLIEICTKKLEEGGRMIYIGAGTSGRIGVLDAVECPPTFGVSDQVVMGLIAGGEGAFVKRTERKEAFTTRYCNRSCGQRPYAVCCWRTELRKEGGMRYSLDCL